MCFEGLLKFLLGGLAHSGERYVIPCSCEIFNIFFKKMVVSLEKYCFDRGVFKQEFFYSECSSQKVVAILFFRIKQNEQFAISWNFTDMVRVSEKGTLSIRKTRGFRVDLMDCLPIRFTWVMAVFAVATLKSNLERLP